MSMALQGSFFGRSEHFEPEPPLEPSEQRKLKGYLEQIDYAAFAANRTVLAQTLGRVDMPSFQHLAVATAHARARWVSAAVALTQKSSALNPDEVAQLGALRKTFEELAEAYDAMRRVVQRGYVHYHARS